MLLDQLKDEIRSCQNCSLCSTMPFKPITSVGPVNANIMIVGEAPGEDESIVEEPFVGQAGKMLDKLLTDAGLDRSTIYISNTVNCRPTNGNRNRPPKTSEINSCKSWLFKQIELVKPKLIFTLGKIPTYVVLNRKAATLKLHDLIGLEHEVGFSSHKCIVIPNLHPSYVMVYGKKEVNLAVETFRKGLKYA